MPFINHLHSCSLREKYICFPNNWSVGHPHGLLFFCSSLPLIRNFSISAENYLLPRYVVGNLGQLQLLSKIVKEVVIHPATSRERALRRSLQYTWVEWLRMVEQMEISRCITVQGGMAGLAGLGEWRRAATKVEIWRVELLAGWQGRGETILPLCWWGVECSWQD